MTELQGRLLALEIDFTGAGTTWDSLVCLQNFDNPLDVPIERVDTDCGSIASPGNPTETVNFSAIKNLEPGVSEESYQACYNAAIAGTKVKVRIQNPAVGSVTQGSKIYKMFDAYFSNVTLEKDTNSPISFSGTIESTGTIDTTP
jgi:hypothetical protein